MSLRALIYAQHGDPSQVIQARSFNVNPHPAANHIRITILLSPINPSDLNIIEGIYPTRPAPRTNLTPLNTNIQEEPVYIAGTEAVGIITELGEAVRTTGDGVLHVGDRVIIDVMGAGAWSSFVDMKPEDITKVPEGLSDVAAATIKGNPPTAWLMLREYVKLEPGEWVIQNAANSAVGKAVIQIAAAMGLKTINLVRTREETAMRELEAQLKALGADHVLTYEDIADKGVMRKTMQEWTGGKDIRLGLNCVGGPDTTMMAGYLGKDAHLVTYGAMSRSPLVLPTSLFIFKNLTSQGHWQTRWYDEHSKIDREKIGDEIAQLYLNGKMKEPDNEVVRLQGTDDDATRLFMEAVKRLANGGTSKKVMLTWDVPS
ncbi:mitochondrial 2-enoyl thioester reductase [Tulasnella sp. 330]|nr:mitochondrial 2-enoyl thioester reductase [Tulasnella sp. 330]KAG8877448.1 mitochondrial 2-enoyl thioester reductase [Tulasnella sp. 332]